MAIYSGHFSSFQTEGSASASLACRLEFDEEALTITPTSGPPLSIDLGDIDEFTPRDYDLALKLYTGETILLSRFGKSFQNLSKDLLEAYRARLVQCLLLDDLEEIDRFEGMIECQSLEIQFAGPAELRIYQSNLAILPQAHTGFQWRLAEIDSIAFDEARYAVTLKSAEGLLIIGRLAKRTREFLDKLQATAAAVTAKSAVTVRTVFPFLTPDQFRRAAEFMKEGRVAPIASLIGIHPKTAQALAEKVVKARLKPCFDYLCARSGADGFYAGFKQIRKEEPEEEEANLPQEAALQESASEDETFGMPPEEESDSEILYWFLFPLRTEGAAVPQMVAWETTSRSGRATYLFRLFSPEEAGRVDPAQAATALDQAIRRLNRGLLSLNFRRAPIYLPDDALALQPRYRRYAIAARKIAAVRFLRAAFLGRAIHGTPTAWQKQVQQTLNSYCRR